MKSKLLTVGLIAIVLSCCAGLAQAGAIRSTGKQIGKTSAAVAGTTASAADAAAGGVATAGKATGNVIKGSAPSVGKGIVGAPRLAARGTAKAGEAIWKAVW